MRSFIENGVRPSLIPLLTSYFQSREMRIKWHGKFSKSKKMPGSGAMGSNIGNLEFDSQTNNNADCVPSKDRFKFVDDLSILEVINLINIGLASHNSKLQVPNDVPSHSQIIPNVHLKTQSYVDNIQKWTKDHQMVISEKKTKSMIINFTDKYQFQTRLKLNTHNIEVVDKMKILGTTFTKDLSWSLNCNIIIKKSECKNAVAAKSLELWVQPTRDGPLVESILSKCP